MNHVALDRDAVEEGRLRRGVNHVRHKGGLNHDERIINIFFIEDMTEVAISKGYIKTTLGSLPIEGSLIR